MGTSEMARFLFVAALVAAASAAPNASIPTAQPTEMPDVSETGTPVMQFAGELWRACEDGDLNARWVGDSGNSHCYMLFNKKKFDDWMGPWIGYSDARVEGQFEWVNGETGVIAENTVYSNWYENMPDNNNQGEDCAHVSGGQWGNKWNDMKCSNKLPYVCEREF